MGVCGSVNTVLKCLDQQRKTSLQIIIRIYPASLSGREDVSTSGCYKKQQRACSFQGKDRVLCLCIQESKRVCLLKPRSSVNSTLSCSALGKITGAE